MRPLRPCPVPSCPQLVRSGRCPAHARQQRQEAPPRERKQDPAQARFYGSPQWKTLRSIVRRRDPICRICERAPSQEVDHKDDDYTNNSLDNLQGVCRPCHATKSGHAHRWKRQDAKQNTPFIILVGLPGVGKTAIRTHLADYLRADSLGPDDFGGSWLPIYEKLDRSPLAVVECCAPPGALVRKADKRRAYVVELTAPLNTRKERLTKRGDRPDAIAAFLAEPRRMGYEHQLEPDLTLDTLADPTETADRIASLYIANRSR